jgi:hypothetical protein
VALAYKDQRSQESPAPATKAPVAAFAAALGRRIFHLKRTTLIVSALCFALGAFSAVAEDKMGHDAMGKPDSHDKMGKADKKGNKDKMGKMDKMEKPNAMQ